MTHKKPVLIIIPGLGDRVRLYSLVKPLWNRLGYDTHIFSFKWGDLSESFSDSLTRLLEHIDSQDAPVYMMGASAGGSAAINALRARPTAIKSVTTIAAAFLYRPRLGNKKLKDSIENLSLSSSPKDNKPILSMYGLYDQTVPMNSSRHLRASYHQIPVIGHALIIFASLTLYSRRIYRFMNKP